jgi:hypothetical protein
MLIRGFLVKGAEMYPAEAALMMAIAAADFILDEAREKKNTTV